MTFIAYTHNIYFILVTLIRKKTDLLYTRLSSKSTFSIPVPLYRLYVRTYTAASICMRTDSSSKSTKRADYILNPFNLTNHNPFQAKSNRLSGTSQNADIILQHCKVPRRADIIFLQHYKVPRRANIFMQTKTETKNKIQVSYQKHKHNHEE